MKNCENCQNPMRLQPAGFSKRTNKPYEAFWVCDQCRPRSSTAPVKVNLEDPNKLMFDEIQALNALIKEESQEMHERLTKMGKFMQDEFKKLNEK